MLLLLVVLLLLAVSSSATAAPETSPCRVSSVRGPSVPAPIVLRTSCGSFRLAPDGTITRLRPGWFAARTGGTGRRYGADLRIQRNRPGRIVLRRHGTVVWRSTSLYRNDAGSVAFGPSVFAFASYRRGIFVTDLTGPERLIMRGVGLYPLAYFADGTLLVTGTGTIAVVSSHGSVLRRYSYRGKNGFAFDERTGSLYFVTERRVLVRAHGTSVTAVRPLQDLDGWISLLDAGRLAFYDERSVAVTRRDGAFVARVAWNSARWSLDSGLSASADGQRFAFRLTKGHRAGRAGGTSVLYLLHAGEKRARAVYRHRLGDSGCAVGASLSWHGSALLYSSTDGHVAVLDTHRGRTRSLATFTASLPRRVLDEKVAAYWMSDFSSPATGMG